ncbi:hypothetical protein Droror1_Dr00019492 [Drosera rotundifolia]
MIHQINDHLLLRSLFYLFILQCRPPQFHLKVVFFVYSRWFSSYIMTWVEKLRLNMLDTSQDRKGKLRHGCWKLLFIDLRNFFAFLDECVVRNGMKYLMKRLLFGALAF